MNISLGSWAFSFGPYADEPIPFDGIARRLSLAGYDGIEICGFPPHVTLDKYPDKASRGALADFLATQRLGVSGYSADLYSVNPLVADNRLKYLDLFARNVEMCVDIGSPAIRVDSVAAPGSVADEDYEPAFELLARVWRDAAEVAAKSKIKLVWEFEPGFIFNKPSEIKRLAERVGHPNFGIIFDTSHAHMCSVAGARQQGKREILSGGVIEFLQLLRDYVAGVHLIDSDGTLYADETSTHTPFGEGLINFKTLTPVLLAVPKIEWWTIDMCFLPESWELVESSLAFVRGLLPQKLAA